MTDLWDELRVGDRVKALSPVEPMSEYVYWDITLLAKIDATRWAYNCDDGYAYHTMTRRGFEKWTQIMVIRSGKSIDHDSIPKITGQRPVTPAKAPKRLADYYNRAYTKPNPYTGSRS